MSPPISVGRVETDSGLEGDLGRIYSPDQAVYRLVKASSDISLAPGAVVAYDGASDWNVEGHSGTLLQTSGAIDVAGIVPASLSGPGVSGTTILSGSYFLVVTSGRDISFRAQNTATGSLGTSTSAGQSRVDSMLVDDQRTYWGHVATAATAAGELGTALIDVPYA